MTYTIFYSNCTISLKENSRIICRKTTMCPLDITFLHTFLYRITRKSTERFFLHKNLTKKKMKISTSPQIQAKCRKNGLH